MIRKTALFAALIAAMFTPQPTQAHRYRRCYPVYARPVYVQPYYCQLPCCYYPAPTYVQYVDYRRPEVALMQDGMNLFFNAISCSRK